MRQSTESRRNGSRSNTSSPAPPQPAAVQGANQGAFVHGGAPAHVHEIAPAFQSGKERVIHKAARLLRQRQRIHDHIHRWQECRKSCHWLDYLETTNGTRRRGNAAHPHAEGTRESGNFRADGADTQHKQMAPRKVP